MVLEQGSVGASCVSCEFKLSNNFLSFRGEYFGFEYSICEGLHETEDSLFIRSRGVVGRVDHLM